MLCCGFVVVVVVVVIVIIFFCSRLSKVKALVFDDFLRFTTNDKLVRCLEPNLAHTQTIVGPQKYQIV